MCISNHNTKRLLQAFLIHITILIFNVSSLPVEIEDYNMKLYQQDDIDHLSEYKSFQNMLHKNYRARRNIETDHEIEDSLKDKLATQHDSKTEHNIMKVPMKKPKELIKVPENQTEIHTAETEKYISSTPIATTANGNLEMEVKVATEKEILIPNEQHTEHKEHKDHNKHNETSANFANEIIDIDFIRKLAFLICENDRFRNETKTRNDSINPDSDSNQKIVNDHVPHENYKVHEHSCENGNKECHSNKNKNVVHNPMEILSDLMYNCSKDDTNKTDEASLKNESEYRVELRLDYIHDQIKRIITDIEEHMPKEIEKETKNITIGNNSLSKRIIEASEEIKEVPKETNTEISPIHNNFTEDTNKVLNINDPKYRIVVDEEEFHNYTVKDSLSDNENLKNSTDNESIKFNYNDALQSNGTHSFNDKMYRIAVDEEEYIESNSTEEMPNNSTNNLDDENLTRISIHINPKTQENTTSNQHSIKKRDESNDGLKEKQRHKSTSETSTAPNINDLDHRIAVDEEEYIATVEEAPKIVNDNTKRPVFKLPRLPIRSNIQRVPSRNQNFKTSTENTATVLNFNSDARVSRILHENRH
ncbi:putative histone-lysine N-methyltransferase 1 [Condylostylus longicornis]|uniref:putative histone-lysine N-methyltransferase 1 n=1 Tax=Condylostylus longicornis TaxID=2530218 RepID=UPI00244DBCF2|nr:putative histone-lysine N-methyltransferase 1 [Condylostylus longicornis]